MTARLLGRLLSLLLVVVFTANTALLPFADAVLDHSRPVSGRPASHLEHPGGCGSHSEHCTLTAGSAMLADHPGLQPGTPHDDLHSATPSTSYTGNCWCVQRRQPPSRAPPVLV